MDKEYFFSYLREQDKITIEYNLFFEQITYVSKSVTNNQIVFEKNSFPSLHHTEFAIIYNPNNPDFFVIMINDLRALINEAGLDFNKIDFSDITRLIKKFNKFLSNIPLEFE